MSIDFSRVEFDTSNPEPRCPCVLLLDTSGSMAGEPIRQLNAGLRDFKEELDNDNLASLRVEIAIITFGPVSLTQDFITAGQFVPPTLHTTGDTPMGGAINLALDKITERKNIYKQSGISYYRPWIFLITDGAPTDEWQSAASRVRDWEDQKKVAFFSVGVAGANTNVLAQMSSRQPLQLQGLKFREMFQWLSASLSGVARSQPDDEVPLQTPIGWGKV